MPASEAKKSKTNQSQGKKAELEKVLDYKTILLITINSIMGTGIFFLPAVGAKHAGPASIISWVLLALFSIYIAMCFGELTSMFPKSGGVYEFCKQAFGRFPSFIIGWTTFIAGNITIAMLVVGAIQYLLPFNIPGIKIPIALTFILLFNYIAYKGMKTSATMLVTFAFITLITLVSLIIPSLFRMETYNFSPFFVFPISSIFVTVFFIAETFFGWETATFLAAETKDGEKVMPKALVVGTVIIAVISIISVITSLGVINWRVFGASSAPLIELGRFHFGLLGRDIFTLLVYLAIIGSVAGWIVSAPRLLLAMAEDKLFLSQLAAIHPKNKTPYKSIIFQTIVSCILVIVGSGSYNTLLHLLVPMLLIMYSFVLLSLVILRYKKPNLKRYYKAPFGKVGPLIAILINMALIVMWLIHTEGAGNTLFLGLGFIALGIPIYYLLELYYDPKVVEKTNDILARLTLLTERIVFPLGIRRRLLAFLGDLKNKKLLEYGASVGTFTIRLAEDVKPHGKIYATNISKHELAILRKRIRKEGHNNVEILKDQPNKIHPSVKKVDAVVSIGMIGSIEKEEKILSQINQRLNKGGRIVFLDYDRFFDVIPNIEWLSDDNEIKRIFKKEGFDVDVFRKQGFAWQYIFIFGYKSRNVKVKNDSKKNKNKSKSKSKK